MLDGIWNYVNEQAHVAPSTLREMKDELDNSFLRLSQFASTHQLFSGSSELLTRCKFSIDNGKDVDQSLKDIKAYLESIRDDTRDNQSGVSKTVSKKRKGLDALDEIMALFCTLDYLFNHFGATHFAVYLPEWIEACAQKVNEDIISRDVKIMKACFASFDVETAIKSCQQLRIILSETNPTDTFWPNRKKTYAVIQDLCFLVDLDVRDFDSIHTLLATVTYFSLSSFFLFPSSSFPLSLFPSFSLPFLPFLT